MKNIKQNWWLILTAVTALWFVVTVSRAQDISTNEATANATAATQVAPATNDANEPPEHLHDLLSIGRDAGVLADEKARGVVVIFGSARILGSVSHDVVVVGGDIDVQGEVQGSVVDVLGNINLGSNAIVHRDVVTVGGQLTRAPGSKLYGRVQPVSINLPGFRGRWFLECVMKLRPLSLRVDWVWGVAGVFFLVYLLIAAVFPQSVRASVEALNTRAVTTLAVGLLGQIVLMVVIVLLAVTIIFIPLIPFVLVAVIVAFLVGKVAFLEYMGASLGKTTGATMLQRPFPAFFVGAAIVTLLYTVPILGLLTFLFISAWSFGAAITAACNRVRRERPPKAPVMPVGPSPIPPSTFTMSAAGFAMAAAAPSSAPMASAETAPLAAGLPPLPAATPPPVTAPSVPSALAFPRAGFWPRMGAGFLDCVLVGLVSARGGPGLFLLAAVAYFAGMWTWKGTTVGGIILRLQVVRTDGQALHFVVALVRALAGVFSAFVLFLGYFWIGWDSEKQGWHDKIAGTVVVRLPHAPSLVCV